MVRHMRDLAYLDVGNDRRDGLRICYGMMRQSHERGQVAEE
jgi:hypothetical protein